MRGIYQILKDAVIKALFLVGFAGRLELLSLKKSKQFFLLEPPFDFEKSISVTAPNIFIFDDLSSADDKKSEVEIERTERYVLEKCPKDFGSTRKCRIIEIRNNVQSLEIAY